MYKYTHTFHLLDGTEIVVKSENEGLSHISLGNEVAFIAYGEDITYTIPFFNVSFIETEDIEQ